MVNCYVVSEKYFLHLVCLNAILKNLIDEIFSFRNDIFQECDPKDSQIYCNHDRNQECFISDKIVKLFF